MIISLETIEFFLDGNSKFWHKVIIVNLGNVLPNIFIRTIVPSCKLRAWEKDNIPLLCLNEYNNAHVFALSTDRKYLRLLCTGSQGQILRATFSVTIIMIERKFRCHKAWHLVWRFSSVSSWWTGSSVWGLCNTFEKTAVAMPWEKTTMLPKKIVHNPFQ